MVLAASRCAAPSPSRRAPPAPSPARRSLPPAAAAPPGAPARQAAAALALALVLASPAPARAISDSQLLFLEAWRAVDRAYVDKSFNGQSWFRVREEAVKRTSMETRSEAYAAVRAALASLGDPYTRFLTPDEAEALQGATSGAVTGVGVQLGPAAEGAAVLATAPGGPAQAAGLPAGALLLSVDAQPLAGLSPAQVASLLQGPAGSFVDVTYRPPAAPPAAPPRAARLLREPIAPRAAAYALCPAAPPAPRVAYLRLPSFSAATPAAAREALAAAAAGGARALVLDLRGNGGGAFPAAVEVARLLLPPRATVVSIADSSGVRDVFDSDPGPQRALAGDTPVALLVDGGTASAAEVLAGALQDNGRAVLFGERTFGKGVIQTTVGLSDGSAVNVTVARYVTPRGADINKVGISPDAPSPLPPGTAAEPAAFCAALTPEVAAALVGRAQ